MERIVYNNNLNENNISYYICPICINLLVEPVKTECNHIFCKICLLELIENSSSELEFKCPMCRTILTKVVDIEIDKGTENYIKSNFSKEFTLREKQLNEYKKSLGNVIKLKILYGNTHKLVRNPKKSHSNSELENKHSWCCFLKILGEDSEKYIKKVEFKLHPTFRLNKIEVVSSPFEISRVGWGTFEIPIKIYWHPHLKFGSALELTHNLSFNDNGETKVYILKISK